MGTQAGTAINPADLLDKLRAFAASEGFTVHAWGDRTDGVAGKHLTISKGALVGTFSTAIVSGVPTIQVHGHDAYNGGLNPMAQANRSLITVTNDVAGPYQAHNFFSGQGKDGAYLHAVLETQPGLFRHFGFGIINKLGAVNTGIYCHGTYQNLTGPPANYVNDPLSVYHGHPFDDRTAGSYPPSTVIRADCDSRTWLHTSNGSQTNPSTTMRCGWRAESMSQGNAAMAMRIGNSTVNGITPLRPIILDALRDGGYYSPIGYVPGIRMVHLRGVAVRQILTRGGDNWICFPVIRKNGTGSAQNSAEYGLAYLANP